jgi:hypothetical protein
MSISLEDRLSTISGKDFNAVSAHKILSGGHEGVNAAGRRFENEPFPFWFFTPFLDDLFAVNRKPAQSADWKGGKMPGAPDNQIPD